MIECNDHIEESGIYHNPLSERRLYCIYSIMKCTVTSGIGLTGGDNWIYGTPTGRQINTLGRLIIIYTYVHGKHLKGNSLNVELIQKTPQRSAILCLIVELIKWNYLRNLASLRTLQKEKTEFEITNSKD